MRLRPIDQERVFGPAKKGQNFWALSRRTYDHTDSNSLSAAFSSSSARAGGPLVAMMRGCFCSNSVGHSSRLMRANKNPALTNRRGDKGWAKNLILHPTYMIARYLFSLPSHPCPFSSSKSRGPISGRQWIQLRPSLLPCCYLSSISPLKNRQEQPKRRSTLITYQRTGQSEVFRSRLLTVRSLPYPLLATRR